MIADDSLERHALIVHIARRLDVIADELDDLMQEYTKRHRKGEPLISQPLIDAERAVTVAWDELNQYLHPLPEPRREAR